MEDLTQAFENLDSRHKAWDLLYLGRFRSNDSLPGIWTKDIPIDEGLVKPGFSYGAHAYALSRNGLESVLSAGFERDIIPVDEFLPALYMIHPRPDVARRYPPRLNAFAIKPHIAFHLPVAELGSDAEASDFVDW
jgi:collagen beta-1,O-galactosyltransferase